MSIIKKEARVISQRQIGRNIYDLLLSFPEAARQAVPGQFVDLYTGDPSKLLPRPISICEADAGSGTLRLVYRVAGGGTEVFSGLKAGDSIEVMGPLGNGFTMKDKKAILVGGGIGIPPMLELFKRLPGEKTVVLGYRDELFLQEDFDSAGLPVAVATEDGSFGTRGTVLDAIEEQHIEGDIIYACGPMPMLRALARYAADRGMEAQISLEERMACGIGACLGCICKTRNKDVHTNVHNKRVCKDGPVFDAREVDFS